MSQSTPYDFSKLVPGFDFLQKLAGTNAQSVPSVSSWVAPTLDPKELEKRIQDLRTVKFWLEQNTQAVSATIQALEVQRMTLSTLQDMNVSMGQLADALKVPSASPSPASTTESNPKPKSSAKPNQQTKPAQAKAAEKSSSVDPMAWWGSLTQQFQQIASEAMQDMQNKSQAMAAATQAPTPKSPKAHPAAKTKRRPAQAKRAK